MELLIHTDGGSRGNPGPSAIGVVINTPTSPLTEFSRFLGTGTNNQAEYQAVIDALKWVKENVSELTKIDFFLDSQLVVSQLSGVFSVKHPNMKVLKIEVDALVSSLPCPVVFKYVPREQNKQADLLVNQALDSAAARPQ